MKGFVGRRAALGTVVLIACIATAMAGAGDALAFEQDQRVNALTMQFGTDAFAPANAFGGAIAGGTVQSQAQASLTSSVSDGSTSWLLRMPGLTDLTGMNSSPFDVGIVDGTPRQPAGNPATYDGASDLDWWYDPAASGLHQLPAGFTAGTFTAGPGTIRLSTVMFGVPADLSLLSTRIQAVSGPSSAPLKSTNGFPPGHLPAENLLDSLTSFQTMGTGQLAGNVSARSLAETPIPASLTGSGLSSCTRAYTSVNSLLDLLVGGCTIFMTQQIRPTQPDRAAVSGDTYTLTTNGTTKQVTGCTRNGSAASLDDCLDGAAYSSYFKFTTDRVIALPVTPETLPDTTITSGPAEGSTITNPTPTFGFTSTVAGSTFECSVDGGPLGPCSGGASHTTAPLADGAHTFAVRAKDTPGHVDPSPATRAFTVATGGPGGGGGTDPPTTGGGGQTDPPATGGGEGTGANPPETGGGGGTDTDPPETTITTGPAGKIHKRKVKYSFGSDEPGSSFSCRLDKGPFKPCQSPAKFRAKAGKHTFQVAATDAAGNTDPTPAKDRFKVLG